MSRQILDNAEIMWARSYLTLEGEPPMVASSGHQTLIGEVTDLAMSSMERARKTGPGDRLAVCLSQT